MSAKMNRSAKLKLAVGWLLAQVAGGVVVLLFVWDISDLVEGRRQSGRHLPEILSLVCIRC
jgi:hypothetical protein